MKNRKYQRCSSINKAFSFLFFPIESQNISKILFWSFLSNLAISWHTFCQWVWVKEFQKSILLLLLLLNVWFYMQKEQYKTCFACARRQHFTLWMSKGAFFLSLCRIRTCTHRSLLNYFPHFSCVFAWLIHINVCCVNLCLEYIRTTIKSRLASNG